MDNIKSKIKKILGKKWTFPAIYIIVVVVILGIMFIYQDSNDYTISSADLGLKEIESDNSIYSDEYINQKLGQLHELDSIAVTIAVEEMKWPIQNPDEVYISMKFFDINTSDEEMEDAIISFQNELWPHNGIDIASNERKFNVVSALSGEVIRADKDPVMGYIVEIQHQENLITKYASLDELKVATGDKVSQGDIVGVSGRNMFEKDYGIHLHFEVVKDGIAYNPELFFNKDVNQILDYITSSEEVIE